MRVARRVWYSGMTVETCLRSASRHSRDVLIASLPISERLKALYRPGHSDRSLHSTELFDGCRGKDPAN
jgi:hypothetical protein